MSYLRSEIVRCCHGLACDARCGISLAGFQHSPPIHLRPQTLRDPAAGQTKRLGVVPHQPKVGVKGGEDGGRDESDGSGEIVELLRLERDGNGRECRLDEVAAWLTRQC